MGMFICLLVYYYFVSDSYVLDNYYLSYLSTKGLLDLVIEGLLLLLLRIDKRSWWLMLLSFYLISVQKIIIFKSKFFIEKTIDLSLRKNKQKHGRNKRVRRS